MKPSLLARLDQLDARFCSAMERIGHDTHCVTLGLVFTWFGALKVLGFKTATSLIAHTVYWGTPEVMVPVLGAWEVVIGLSLVARRFLRLALLLMAIRLPGTLLALLLLPGICFVQAPWVPTIEGQYLIKDLLLFGAGLVIGGTIRSHAPPPHPSP